MASSLILTLDGGTFVEGNSYKAEDGYPALRLVPEDGTYPTGWQLLHYRIDSSEDTITPGIMLYDADHAETWLALRSHPGGVRQVVHTVNFPPGIRSMVLRIGYHPTTLQLSEVRFTPASRLLAYTRLIMMVAASVRPILTQPGLLLRATSRGLSLLRGGGLRALLDREHSRRHELKPNDYRTWISRHDLLTESDRIAIREHGAHLPLRPLISVIMPVYNTPPAYLRAAIESVLGQLYDRFELCIADDCSTDPAIRPLLEDYAARDSRVKLVFRTENGHISQASNSALELAQGEFIALLDHDDVLTPHALYMVSVEINRHPDVGIIYSDIDKIDIAGRRCDPYFKSSWNPDLILSQNYFNHLTVYRRSTAVAAGGFRVGFESSQDYDLALRMIERTPGPAIRHIPFVLYHWRAIPGSVALSLDQESYATERARQAITEHLARCGIAATVEPSPSGCFHRVRRQVPEPAPRVSLIIPTRDRLELVRGAVDSILNHTDYPNYEIIIVDNQSSDPATLAWFRSLDAHMRVRVVRYDAPFNYSAINNFAVAHGVGDIVGLINNDILVIDRDWLSEMVSHAVRPEVGAVGALLYYPNDTVQQAGIILGVGGVAVNGHVDLPRGETGYFGRAELIQNYSAVTAACLLSRTVVYREVGGLDEANLAVAFNDVDYCLRVREKGYLITWTPHAQMYHLESATRGDDMAPEKRKRFDSEVRYMIKRWGESLRFDPYYNPNLTLTGTAFERSDQPRRERPWQARGSTGVDLQPKPRR
ncbi:MAG: glycosyltransferase family 2 protein [Rhodospirillaceae bacterium]